MIDLAQLNDHSRQFARLLFREWPEWLPHARFDPFEEFEQEALLVEVPRPVDGSGHGLFVTTSEWEIAVGYGENFHTRFGAADGEAESDFYAAALAWPLRTRTANGWAPGRSTCAGRTWTPSRSNRESS